MKQRPRSTMRKQGPCCHCGVKETPLWRKGPSEKPVLCNACGSRWRIRGNLHDYVPIKRGSVVRREKKRSTKKWIENDDDEEEDDSNNEDESDEEWRGDRQCRKLERHSGSVSESVTTSSEEPSNNLYEVVVQSEIISIDEDEDGSDDSHVALEETKVQGNDAESAWVTTHDGDPLAHIKMLQRELYNMFKNEKSSSSSSSSCSSLAEPPEENEVLLYNLSNPHICENEIGFGSFLLKPP